MTNITRWNPLRETNAWSSLASTEPTGFLSLRNVVDRLYQDAFIRPAELFGWAGPANGFGSLALDLYETDGDCIVRVALPGVSPEDVDVSVQGDVLTIRAESKDEEEQTQGSYRLRERYFGSFQRQVRLPAPVNVDGAETQFEHGVLTLRLPKVEAARQRKIQITSGSGVTQPADLPKSDKAA